jgi:diguanylate cyclase (GGDEF)-like protein/PAS domain S-box-containing protein
MDIRHRLLGLGYDVVGGAATGEAAIRKAGELLPNLILMDIKLKGEMDGIQAAEVIRKRYNLPVIFLTAFADETTLQRARVTEAFGYVLKPFEERELSVNIEMALYKHQAEQKLRDSETRLRTIFDSALDGMFVINMQGKYVDVNASGCRMFGYTAEEILASDISLLLFPEDIKKAFQNGTHLWREGSEIGERRMRRKDGTPIWIEMRVAPLILSGEEYALAAKRDVTQRKQSEAALKESEERYMLAAQGANDGLWDWNLLTDSIYFSPRWKSILGYSDLEVSARPSEWFDRVHPDDLDQLKVNLSAHLKGLTQHFEHEHRMQHKDNTYRWVLTRGMAVRDPGRNIVYRLSGSQTDITHRKRAEEQLLYDAFHDDLTGLPNRALFLDRLAQVLAHSSSRDDYAFGVLFLDLDQFKIVNDSLGHNLGNDLLVAISELLEGCVRSIDTVARLGGDEFVILLEDIESLEDTIRVSDRIKQAFQASLQIGDHSIHTSASIGVVFSNGGYERPEDILRDADIAMYRAKILGKDRCVIFEPQMRKQAVARLELENDLRRALECGEFQLYYQAILSLAANQIEGFEALIRWRHPEHGILLPGEFISVAEETGLILPMGQWVLREACRQFQAWRANLPGVDSLYVSVNVSGKQLANPEYIHQVLEVLEETGIEPKNLRLEITESTLIENNALITDKLKILHQMGIQLYIDDFGTGYSSLSYIQHFPISTIKIDRSFVEQMSGDGDNNSSEMIQSILRFAKDMGLAAIAEGIETEQQFERLKSMLCNYGQGFYISRPLDSNAAEAMLLQSNRSQFIGKS